MPFKLSTSVDEVFNAWGDLYCDATQRPPLRTLRAVQVEILRRLLTRFGVVADESSYVDLFFQITTRVELYPDARAVLSALAPIRAAILSNADHEHLAAWNVTLPVEFVFVSEALQAYKPDPFVSHRVLERLQLPPADVLHVGDSPGGRCRRGEGRGIEGCVGEQRPAPATSRCARAGFRDPGSDRAGRAALRAAYQSASGRGRPASASIGIGAGGVTRRRSAST
jgi:HAD superfamily hydrolase (TIGR01493 family)